jgi:beta-glucosidase
MNERHRAPATCGTVVFMDPDSLPDIVESSIDAVVDKLGLDQQVRLLTGEDFWSLYAEPAIDLRKIVVSDGPSGVRGETWDERDPSLNLPSATALAASWDPELAYEYGTAMAAEALRKGVDVVLGPTINLHRSPLGGRHFEAYSEDPVLTGALAVGMIRGLQDHGVGACPKHYVANDFETERFTASVELPERALRELYMAPFERAVIDGGAWTIMSAYNAVRGVTMTENDLLTSPLCDEWGFDGVVISDWTAVRSVDAALARQDLVMPGPGGAWGPALVDAVHDGRVPAELIVEKVRRLVRLAIRLGAIEEGEAPLEARATMRPTAPEGIQLARTAEARGIVLVANRDAILPLEDVRSVALIGEHASRPRTQGGGSATVIPVETVSPLDGLREALPDVALSYHVGAVANPGLQSFALETLVNPETGEHGVQVEFVDTDGQVLLREGRYASSLLWLGTAPAGATRLIVRTDYTPAATEAIEIGVKGAGRSVLSVDDVVLLDGAPEAGGTDPGAMILYPPAQSVPLSVEAGVVRHLDLVYDLALSGPLARSCAVTLGWQAVDDAPEELIAEAARAAGEADVAVVVVGTNEQVESEGFDRTSLSLPGRQDELVAAVAAANPRTVVVVNAGSPVVMPWRDQVAAVLLTWFGGQEYGRALADVLTGAAEPGGRLPTTWPAAQADVPVIDVTPRDGVLRYDEGIHIGYRAWLKVGTAPAYPFGYGLGYTTWAYGDAAARPTEAGVEIDVTVTNTGPRAGREVIQVYANRPDSAVDRPVRWLVGFANVEAGTGESAAVTIPVPTRAFEHWDETAAGWTLEPGPFGLTVSRHAAETGLPLAAIPGGK